MRFATDLLYNIDHRSAFNFISCVRTMADWLSPVFRSKLKCKRQCQDPKNLKPLKRSSIIMQYQKIINTFVYHGWNLSQWISYRFWKIIKNASSKLNFIFDDKFIHHFRQGNFWQSFWKLNYNLWNMKCHIKLIFVIEMSLPAKSCNIDEYRLNQG